MAHEHILAYWAARRASARQSFRDEFAEALTDWRLGTNTRPRFPETEALFRAGVSEILRLRLEAAYAPIWQVFARIERDVVGIGVLAQNSDPWAPPSARGAGVTTRI